MWICSCPQSADIPVQCKAKVHFWPLVTILDTSLSWRNLESLEQVWYKKRSLYCSPVPDKVSWNLLTDANSNRDAAHPPQVFPDKHKQMWIIDWKCHLIWGLLPHIPITFFEDQFRSCGAHSWEVTQKLFQKPGRGLICLYHKSKVAFL